MTDEPKYGTPEWDAYIAEARAVLESQVGQVWNTSELTTDFEVSSFLAPLVFVTRKDDNAKGAMLFDHSPRFYYSFKPNLR